MVALLLAACGSAGQSGGGPNQAGKEVTRLKVAYVPAVTFTYLWQAQEAGYFKSEGLDVELVSSAGGLATVPAIEAHEIQFGGTDVMGAISAVEHGVPVRFLTVPAFIESVSPMESLMTGSNDIKTAKDLVGKRVAVNFRFNIEWVMLRQWLRAEGVDPDKVDIVEVPFPDMLQAVKSGTVAAAGFAEPFVTIAKNQGLRSIGEYWAEVTDSIAASGILGDLDFMNKNPTTTKHLLAALKKAVEDVAKNPDLSRTLLQKYAKMDPVLSAAVKLPAFSNEPNAKSIEQWVQWAKKDKVIKKDLTLNDLLWKGLPST